GERFRNKKPRANQARPKPTQTPRPQTDRRGVSRALASLPKRPRRLGFESLDPPRSGKTVVEVEWPELRAGDRLLLTDVSFAIDPGEHVAPLRPNGSRKTTPLERMPPHPPGHRRVPPYFSPPELP